MPHPAVLPDLGLPVRRVSTRRGRMYQVGDDQFPSMTNVLGVLAKPALVGWAANLERQHVVDHAAALYRDQYGLPQLGDRAFRDSLRGRLGSPAHRQTVQGAQTIGSEAHALIEWQMRRRLGQPVDDEPVVSEGAALAVMAFEDWARSVTLTPIASETMIYSAEHRFGGTLDLVAEVDGVVVLIDFKTSKRLYIEHHLQNVGYQIAWREMGYRPCGGGLIVRLPKTLDDKVECEVVPVRPVEDTWPAVEAAIQLWWWLHDRRAS